MKPNWSGSYGEFDKETHHEGVGRTHFLSRRTQQQHQNDQELLTRWWHRLNGNTYAPVRSSSCGTDDLSDSKFRLSGLLREYRHD